MGGWWGSGRCTDVVNAANTRAHRAVPAACARHCTSPRVTQEPKTLARAQKTTANRLPPRAANNLQACSTDSACICVRSVHVCAPTVAPPSTQPSPLACPRPVRWSEDSEQGALFQLPFCALPARTQPRERRSNLTLSQIVGTRSGRPDRAAPFNQTPWPRFLCYTCATHVLTVCAPPLCPEF